MVPRFYNILVLTLRDDSQKTGKINYVNLGDISFLILGL